MNKNELHWAKIDGYLPVVNADKAMVDWYVKINTATNVEGMKRDHEGNLIREGSSSGASERQLYSELRGMKA